MTPQTERTPGRGLRAHAANILTLICAAVIVAAVVFLSPWVDQTGLIQSQLTAQGIELPAGFGSGQFAQSGSLPEGFTPPTGGQFPGAAAGATDPTASGANASAFAGIRSALAGVSAAEAATQTPGWAMGLLLGAALAAAGAAIWSWVDPRANRTIPLLILVCGLVALLHFAYFVGVQNRNASTNLLTAVSPGFWIALVASVGLLLQALIKRPVPTSALVGTTLVERPAQQRRGGVSLGQNIFVAFDALLANKLRSTLTMLGIVIGVMSVVALLSVGQGATAGITSQIEGIGTNLITVSPMRVFGGSAGTLTLKDSEAIRDFDLRPGRGRAAEQRERDGFRQR